MTPLACTWAQRFVPYWKMVLHDIWYVTDSCFRTFYMGQKLV